MSAPLHELLARVRNIPSVNDDRKLRLTASNLRLRRAGWSLHNATEMYLASITQYRRAPGFRVATRARATGYAMLRAMRDGGVESLPQALALTKGRVFLGNPLLGSARLAHVRAEQLRQCLS